MQLSHLMLRRCISCSSWGDSMMYWALRQPGRHWCTAGAAHLASAGCAAGGIKHGYHHTLVLYPWTARFLGLSFSVKGCWFLNGGNRLKHMMCEKNTSGCFCLQKHTVGFLPSERGRQTKNCYTPSQSLLPLHFNL